jgi:hypothetical protein
MQICFILHGIVSDVQIVLILLGLLARPERFERPTPRFVVWCSIQLSYGRFAVRGGPGSRA